MCTLHYRCYYFRLTSATPGLFLANFSCYKFKTLTEFKEKWECAPKYSIHSVFCFIRLVRLDITFQVGLQSYSCGSKSSACSCGWSTFQYAFRSS